MKFQKFIPAVLILLTFVTTLAVSQKNSHLTLAIHDITITADVDFEKLSGDIAFYDNDSKNLLMKNGRANIARGWVLDDVGGVIGHRGYAFIIVGTNPVDGTQEIPLPKLALK